MREITENGKAVLNRRYLMKDDKGNVIETPQQLFQRVAEHVANAERLYPTAGLEIGRASCRERVYVSV